MTTPHGNTPLRFIGLTRKSAGEDEGTHSDQRRIIEQRCEREGFVLVRVDTEHKVSGKKPWREREVGRAVEDIKTGRADGIIVAYEDRISREKMSATAEMWDAFREAGIVFIACDGIDSRQEGSDLTFAIKAAIAREKITVGTKRSNDGRKRSVIEHNIHGGEVAPHGYSWTWRETPDGPKHGPLVPNEDAPKVTAAFEAAASDDPAEHCQANIARILGVRSKSAAMKVVRNRVYLGEARSGEYVKQGAHPALVDEALWDRVQRKLDGRRGKNLSARKGSHERALLAGGILLCGTCRKPLHLERSIGSYRHKSLDCAAPATIKADVIEPFALRYAKDWHAAQSAEYLLTREVEDAMLPVLEDALREAEGKVAELDAALDSGELDAVTYSKAAAAARKTVDAARLEVEKAEDGRGWLGMTPERVVEKLAEGGTEAARSFIADNLRLYVEPVGRGRRVPVAQRVHVMYLTAGKTASECLGHEDAEGNAILPAVESLAPAAA